MLDKRIQMINMQNIELLKEEFNFDDFYTFLRRLEFLNFDNLVLHAFATLNRNVTKIISKLISSSPWLKYESNSKRYIEMFLRS